MLGTAMRSMGRASFASGVRECFGARAYGTDSELRKRHESMIDSLGNMGAAYIDDLNYSTYGSAAAVRTRIATSCSG
ncbi:hypothetical protein GCM10019017_66420 [Streptomyces showdoensis]